MHAVDHHTSTVDAAAAFERYTSDEISGRPTHRDLLADEARVEPPIVDATLVVCRRCGTPRERHCTVVGGIELDCTTRFHDAEKAVAW